ncbi:hypothetical protein J6590_058747 [Homalodisca vitripennis]|nr:hypothetical protein J6590_058747 [Homalodisca vitripennis]
MEEYSTVKRRVKRLNETESEVIGLHEVNTEGTEKMIPSGRVSHTTSEETERDGESSNRSSRGQH